MGIERAMAAPRLPANRAASGSWKAASGRSDSCALNAATHSAVSVTSTIDLELGGAWLGGFAFIWIALRWNSSDFAEQSVD